MSVSKTAALAVAVSALALASCGGEDEGGQSGSGQGSNAAQRDGEGAAGASPPAGGQAPGQGRQGGDEGGSSEDFTPRSHEDSGGGSESFRVQGGDNSVQDYGSEETGSDFEQAAAALHGFYDARAAGAWAAACEYLARNLVSSLEGGESPTDEDDTSCAQGLRRFTNPEALKALRAEARQVDVASLRAEGDSGFLLYRDRDGTPFAIPVEKEDGRWRLTNLAGYPLG